MVSDVKILIVDDGSLSSLRILTGLKNHGFNYIELAINSNCMFDYLDRGHFGLIISNWSRMEMPGKELIRTVRKYPRYRDLPLIMLANSTETMDSTTGLWNEDVRFINNPLDFNVLTDAIREVLEKSETLK